MSFGVASVVGGPAAPAKTLPICSWLRAHLLPSHLIQQEPSLASSSVLREAPGLQISGPVAGRRADLAGERLQLISTGENLSSSWPGSWNLEAGSWKLEAGSRKP